MKNQIYSGPALKRLTAVNTLYIYFQMLLQLLPHSEILFEVRTVAALKWIKKSDLTLEALSSDEHDFCRF